MSAAHPWWHKCRRWEKKGFKCPFGGRKEPWVPDIDWDEIPPERRRDRSRLRPGQAVQEAQRYLERLAARTAAQVAKPPGPVQVPAPVRIPAPVRHHLAGWRLPQGMAKPVDVKALVVRLMEAGLLAAKKRGSISPVALERLLVQFLAKELTLQGARWYRQTDWSQVLGAQNAEWIGLRGAWIARVGRFMQLTGGAMKGFGGGGSGAHR